MPAYVSREEFEAPIGLLECEVEGERLPTRHILEQTRRNGDDLAAVRAELKGLARDVGSINVKLTQEVASVNAKLSALVRNLPTTIAEALRKDRSGRRKKT
ncbi:MAG TPA: hypothetical protein VKC66_05190 [Xanthobacteraceae bacterium]|nr:hypothetical protein [Xanthobacteraceae bacterium]